jgi:hypothetical protein
MVNQFWLSRVFILLAVTVLIQSSCSRSTINMTDQAEPGTVLKEFETTFFLNFKLPIDESVLLYELDNKKIPYVKFGPGGEFSIIPKPDMLDNQSQEKILHAYRVYGPFDESTRIKRDYHLYVNNDKEIFHIERAFAFPIP